VTFGPEVLLERLDALETAGNRPDRYVIALSGGLDSAVLAHALAVSRERHGKSLLAVHVDHQLHPESPAAVASRLLRARHATVRSRGTQLMGTGC
jgi:tRNA(Ile)-lysidine synthase TilS/MesJ